MNYSLIKTIQLILRRRSLGACFVVLLFISVSCSQKKEKTYAFEVLTSEQTGLNFSNKLTPTPAFNMFKYMYFYNGAGVGAGDFNNDGLIDLFFSANQAPNALYLNNGNMQFRDVTSAAQIPNDSAWSTGVSVVDINNDGLLDIYVCRVGNFETLHGKNQLLICEGIKEGVPFYKDRAKEYQLDFSGFSTQAAFLDYDLDGDLDMFLLNHSVHQNGTFGPRASFLGTYHRLSGDRFYRNDGNIFTDVTRQTGINSSAISYGLGVCVADINLDGYPDIYAGNDFHENDYLYINQHDGTFREEGTARMMHTSQFSMGVDVADINNDAYPEIISVDMLPGDPYILKRSLGEDEYNTFFHKVSLGYSYQYTRNNLQLNRSNGMFSEVGLYAGVDATDWSWAALWMDFDNDGSKDLFVSNGIPKRLNDIDYVNFVSNDDVQARINADKVDEKDLALVDKYPEIKLPNKFFRNKGQVQFEDIAGLIKNDRPTFSNGSVYADLDNDGDLDVVVNNIADPPLIYQNKTNDQQQKKHLSLHLNGSPGNIHATGAKLIVYSGGDIRTYEKNPVRGFQSSMELPLHVGLSGISVDSMVLIWPDNSYQLLDVHKDSGNIVVSYKLGLPSFNYNNLIKEKADTGFALNDITSSSNLLFVHKENLFNEFDREPLMPHMVSREGPALAVADINHDGLEDVYIGAAKWDRSGLFMQKPNGKFERSFQPALENDSTAEDIDACWTDVNNDAHIDLVVASGGNEFYGHDANMLPRLYLNDGKGQLQKKVDAFDTLYMTASCVVPNDFNGDGFVDLFIGARSVPWEYGQKPRSYLLQNDGTGKFKDVTLLNAKDLANIGMITSASWFDIDRDNDLDLLLTLEWDGICFFKNNNGKFEKQYISTKKGWWNFVLPLDADNDGDIDFIAGNLGENSRLHASDKQPVTLYYGDFDNNGRKEQLLTYYLQGREIPFANKDELQKQIPVLKKKFLYAEDFAKASLEELIPKDKLDAAAKLTADYFANAVLINDGKMNFTLNALPWQAQLTSYKDAVVVDVNHDQLQDVFLVGNFYANNIQMGRYDADFGSLLINKGNGSFECRSVPGQQIKGEVRHVKKIRVGPNNAFVFARNNDAALLMELKK